jgi:hypothetical protein
MGSWRRATCAVTVWIALLAATASPATAGTIATVNGITPLSAGGGWLVWSSPGTGGWVLMAYHDGRVRQLPLAPRSEPFDASVGSNARGAPVVSFSRCKHTPRMSDLVAATGPGGALVEPASGAGCRIRVVALDGGPERVMPIPEPSGVSDTSPSMWHGQVTFARRAPGHGDVWQVMSWSPRAPRRLMVLPHGRIPSCPEKPGGCTERAHGSIVSLDRDGAIVTFLWTVPEGEGVVGEGAWEVRVDRVGGSGKALAEGGFGHEACMGDTGLEYVWPEPPIAVGVEALVPNVYAYDCFQRFASTLARHSARPEHASIGGLGAIVVALADDQGQLYGLVPTSPIVGDGPSCEAKTPCAIETLAMPRLHIEHEGTFTPFP